MLRLLVCLFLFMSIVSCGTNPLKGNLKENMAELDKKYGVCGNPMRNYSKNQRLTCEAKERAAGPDGQFKSPLNLTEIIDNYRSGGATVYASSAVNNHLWNASVSILEPYTLKIVDSQGGLISTDWIMEKSDTSKRCLIKVNITSKELLSNGVDVKILCEEKDGDNWFSDEASYLDEEKRLTLKVLEIAEELKTTEELSK